MCACSCACLCVCVCVCVCSCPYVRVGVRVRVKGERLMSRVKLVIVIRTEQMYIKVISAFKTQSSSQ